MIYPAACSNTAAAPRHGSNRVGLFGPPATVEQCPNWRCILANELAQHAKDHPPTHDDPWIEATAGLVYASLHGTQDELVPTARQLHILQAFQLHRNGRLVTKVLECRLAGDESLDQIASRCNAHRDTIAAYAAILCDLSHHRRFQAWGTMQLNPINHTRRPVGPITTVLQSSFMFGGCEGLEEAVGVLCRLEGPTMADGLPAHDAPGFLKEFSRRSAFAQALLPRSKKNLELMYRFGEACRGEAPGAAMSAEAIDIGMEILRRVKIPEKLQEEIRQLREFCRLTDAASVAGAVPDTEAVGD